MINVTMIRHKKIGNKVGVVISSSKCDDVQFHFQIYLAGKPGAATLMIGSWPWSVEANAIDHFDNWVKEAQLEAA